MGEWWNKHMASKLEKLEVKSQQGSDFGAVIPLVKVENVKPPSTGALIGVGIVIGGLLAFGGYKVLSEMDSEQHRLTPGRTRYL